jgi:hypothetical protein
LFESYVVCKVTFANNTLRSSFDYYHWWKNEYKIKQAKGKNIEQWHSWNMKFDVLIGNNKFKQKQRLMMQLYICNDVAIGFFHRCQSPCHINSSIIQNRLYMHRYIVWKTKFFNWTLFEKCIFICKNVHSIKHQKIHILVHMYNIGLQYRTSSTWC